LFSSEMLADVHSKPVVNTHPTQCNWDKATVENMNMYKHCLDNLFQSMSMSDPVIYCKDLHCNDNNHLHALNEMCHNIIECCLNAGNTCIPMSKPYIKRVPGWSDNVSDEKETSLFWHWIWLESGKPNSGYVYNIMKRTRHLYHYAIRRIKKDELLRRREKLASKMSSSKCLWRELKHINPNTNNISCTVDNATNPSDIAEIFVNKYRTLYNSVPTDTHELSDLTKQINANINMDDYSRIRITPGLIINSIKRLKPGKSDGKDGFKSDHLINGSSRLFVLLSIMFHCMIIHGFNPDDLLHSSIISIPKDVKGNLSNSNNYRGISLFNSICKLFDIVILDLFKA